MSENLSPMMQQYQSVKRSLPSDVILFFRLGDFYEMFFEDAREAASVLNVALTKRGVVPMCGVPYHAAGGYISRLVQSGKRVAICDQVGEVKPGKIVDRQVTRIVSAGTIDDMQLLDSRRPNYLGAVCLTGKRYGIAVLELTTGDFRVAEAATAEAMREELDRLGPAELVVPEEQRAELGLPNATGTDDYAFAPEHARFVLCEHFAVRQLDGFGCEGLDAAVAAGGGLMHHVRQVMRREPTNVRTMRVWQPGSTMMLDSATRANLEIVEARSREGTSLFAALDRTVTPMGARMLREWLLHPLRDVVRLVQRQDAVALLLDDALRLGEIRELLGDIRDIERIMGRLAQGSGNARDLLALRTSLQVVPGLREKVAGVCQCASPASTALYKWWAHDAGDYAPLAGLLARAIVDEPPTLVREGGMIRDGYCATLDELRTGSREGKSWIAELQEREIVRTGIKSLKVRFNSVFGYFIEITKANLASVPEDYHRKQTTVNGERYITPELKEMEAKILGADERSRQREYEIFLEVRTEVLTKLEAIQSLAAAVALLDVCGSFAESARQNQYCRPILREGGVLRVLEGRHPVLDQKILEERFVPNDLEMAEEGTRLHLITGPNMAGKSTYIRQIALLVLMAQTGSYLPAKYAEIGIADRIFTRVGASDDLARGLSTFMVEMSETSNILNNATESSLVILDEIGRGTSTFDGLAIAWSVAEFLHDKIGARTLFATHFHEITRLAGSLARAANFSIAVREWNEQVIFLRKIVPGAADRSYGIQVARLAGLPASVLERAKQLLENLEKSDLHPALERGTRRKLKAAQDEDDQLPLWATR